MQMACSITCTLAWYVLWDVSYFTEYLVCISLYCGKILVYMYIYICYIIYNNIYIYILYTYTVTCIYHIYTHIYIYIYIYNNYNMYVYIGFTVTCKLWIGSTLGHRWSAMATWTSRVPYRVQLGPAWPRVGSCDPNATDLEKNHFLPSFDMGMAEKWLKHGEILLWNFAMELLWKILWGKS